MQAGDGGRDDDLAVGVLALHAVGLDDRARVGTKAATLGLLARAGLAVPEALIITTGVTDAGLAAAVDRVAVRLGDTTLAVRSSAVAEDGAGASFAGQYDTVLGVRGRQALADAVARCRAAAAGERVRAYRERAASDANGANGTDDADGTDGLAVLVQRQVDADVAGVAFTADPVTGDTDRVLVSAVPGLGDALVDGRATADEWVVTDAGASAVRVPHRALAEAQARAVAALALRVCDVLGGDPVDVEWAMADGRLVVLQARPITALPRRPELDIPDGTWVRESERHPEPLTALGASVVTDLVGAGLTAMSARYGGLIERFETRAIGGEPYLRITPVGGRGGPPPAWWAFAVIARLAPPMRARLRTARAMIRDETLDAVARRWWDQWRPDLRARAAALRAVDLAPLDDAALRAHIEAVFAAARDAMDIHFRLIPPYLVPVYDLVRACRDLLGWPEVDALTLLAGTSPATSSPTRDLADLAARIRQRPEALATVRGADDADLAAALAATDPEIGAGYDEWCAAYARRNLDNDPGSPTLAEQPHLIASLLRDAVAAADVDDDPAAAARAAAQRRARDRLAARPPRERERFEHVLASALRAYPLREDAALWTGSTFGALLREAALAVGQRLVERGVLARADDAVHLELATVARAAGGDVDGGLRERVARARAERAWMTLHPGPPCYGPAPAEPPDVRGLPGPARRLNEAMLWMQRRAAAPEPGPDADVINGVAASGGRYTGPVRLVRTTADFDRLRRGDVLVCPTTDPAWSVLFGVAGALITDGGAVLSHAAIVAREYAIPAVVGTGDATGRLHDGDVVTVDGSAGIVRLAR